MLKITGCNILFTLCVLFAHIVQVPAPLFSFSSNDTVIGQSLKDFAKSPYVKDKIATFAGKSASNSKIKVSMQGTYEAEESVYLSTITTKYEMLQYATAEIVDKAKIVLGVYFLQTTVEKKNLFSLYEIKKVPEALNVLELEEIQHVHWNFSNETYNKYKTYVTQFFSTKINLGEYEIDLIGYNRFNTFNVIYGQINYKDPNFELENRYFAIYFVKDLALIAELGKIFHIGVFRSRVHKLICDLRIFTRDMPEWKLKLEEAVERNTNGQMISYQDTMLSEIQKNKQSWLGIPADETSEFEIRFIWCIRPNLIYYIYQVKRNMIFQYFLARQDMGYSGEWNYIAGYLSDNPMKFIFASATSLRYNLAFGADTNIEPAFEFNTDIKLPGNGSAPL